MNRIIFNSSILRSSTTSKHANLFCSSYALFSPVRGFARRRKQIKMPVPQFRKRLDCVIFGLPNVGKSVLLNELVKQKLAATCHKRHTTRDEILGVFNHRHTQLVFFDTPGYIANGSDLKKEMKTLRETATSSLDKSDVVLLVVDAARRLDHNGKYLFGEMARLALQKARKEIILVLNKVDLVYPKERLLELTHEYVSLINGIKLGPEYAHLAQLDTTTFMISALKNDGVLDLKNYLIQIADMKPWLLSSEEGITDMTDEQRVEEIVMEKLMMNVHDEIPYTAEIECTDIEHSAHHVKVNVAIILEANRQQKIVLGHQGRTMLKIRQDTSAELEKIYNNKTVLVFFDIKSKKGKNNASTASSSGSDGIDSYN